LAQHIQPKNPPPRLNSADARWIAADLKRNLLEASSFAAFVQAARAQAANRTNAAQSCEDKSMTANDQPLTHKVETARGVRTLAFPAEIVAQKRGVPRTIRCYAVTDEVRMVRIETRRADGLRFNVLDEYNQPLNDAPVQWEIIWR